eukprot:7378025-Prymnesium_polylepis.1
MNGAADANGVVGRVAPRDDLRAIATTMATMANSTATCCHALLFDWTLYLHDLRGECSDTRGTPAQARHAHGSVQPETQTASRDGLRRSQQQHMHMRGPPVSQKSAQGPKARPYARQR